MTTVKIREQKGEFQLYEKQSGKIVFRGESRLDCKKFLAGKIEFSYEPTREKGSRLAGLRNRLFSSPSIRG